MTSILGPISSEEFLQHYWQQRPLCIREAFAGYNSPISADELAGLSLEPSVESRIVLTQNSTGDWELRHGPFPETTYAELPEHSWTLLVQALDLWLPEAKELLDRFDFLPPWRIDDLMASYATPGGSVGPHFDQYDVFLLQVEGLRRWQIGGYCDNHTPLRTDTELSILKDFTVEQEWLLEPGDMLYLPPGLAHWGVADTECITFSIGFRSPSLSDMLADLAVEQDARLHTTHYRDPKLEPNMATVNIAPAFIAQAQSLLQTELKNIIQNDQLIADWLARYMTRLKYPELAELNLERRRAQVGDQEYLNGEPI